MRFFLYRIQVFRDAQLTLPHLRGGDEEDLWPKIRPEMVKTIIQQSDVRAVRSGEWGIDNVEALSKENCLYLRIGKTRKVNIQRRDEQGFNTATIDSAPWTHVVVDTSDELCAVASNSKLSASTNVIATALERILNSTARRAVRVGSSIKIEITSIVNPESIIQLIRDAHRVTRLRATFRRPNAFDVEKDFIQPVQRITTGLDANRGSVTFEGKDLRRDNVEKTIRSIAATGDDAQVTIKAQEGTRAQVRELRGDNPATLEVPEDQLAKELKDCGIVYRMKALYASIRGALTGGGPSGGGPSDGGPSSGGGSSGGDLSGGDGSLGMTSHNAAHIQEELEPEELLLELSSTRERA